jgi:raffinose/stachyose/melibiose transport system substrate-binding protein
MHQHVRSRLVLVTALLATLAAGVLAGCGGSGGGSGKKVVLHFLTYQEEDTRLEAQRDQQIDQFNKEHPNIEVKRESMDNDQLRTVLKTRLNSNDGPDVFAYDTGPGYGGVLAKAHLVMPLDAAYAKYKWPIYGWARKRATYSGKTFAIPDQVEEVGIFYNEDLFKKLGVQVPRSLADLQHVADVAKSRGVIPLAFADKDQWPAYHQFSMVTSNLLGPKGLTDILFGNGSWTNPEVVKGIDLYFRQFEQQGFFPKGVNGIGYDDGNALFYQGRAAMLPTGTWIVSDAAQKAAFKVGFFPFPSIDGSSVAPPAGVGNGYFVSARSKHKAQALQFLDWWLGKENSRENIQTFNAIPAEPVDTSGLKVTPLFKQVLTDLGKAADDASAFGYNIDVLTPTSFNDVMSSGFQDVLNGSRTPQQQAQALEAAWQKAKKAGDVLKP